MYENNNADYFALLKPIQENNQELLSLIHYVSGLTDTCAMYRGRVSLPPPLQAAVVMSSNWLQACVIVLTPVEHRFKIYTKSIVTSI